MAVLLDSTVIVDALRGRPAAGRIRALRATGDVPYVCAVTAEEVHRGVRPGEMGAVAVLLASLRPAPLGPLEGALAGEWRRRFSQQGVTLSQADCLIAAAAVGVHAVLATGNPTHFPMEGVTVEHWPVGA